MEEPAVYARIGERVTCSHGHEIAVMKKTMMCNEEISALEFFTWYADIPPNEWWNQECPCGHSFFGHVYIEPMMRAMLHFRDGWRFVMEGAVVRTHEPEGFGPISLFRN